MDMDLSGTLEKPLRLRDLTALLAKFEKAGLQPDGPIGISFNRASTAITFTATVMGDDLDRDGLGVPMEAGEKEDIAAGTDHSQPTLD